MKMCSIISQDSQKSSSGFDMSNMTGTLLKEMSDVLPIK